MYLQFQIDLNVVFEVNSLYIFDVTNDRVVAFQNVEQQKTLKLKG